MAEKIKSGLFDEDKLKKDIQAKQRQFMFERIKTLTIQEIETSLDLEELKEILGSGMHIELEIKEALKTQVRIKEERIAGKRQRQ